MAVYLLDKELWFPDPRGGEPNGLIAVGGDLSVDRLVLAYSHGIFPWFSFRRSSKPYWYCPLKRFVIFADEIHVSHTMRQMLRNRRYVVTIDADFDGVIRGCSQADGRYSEAGAWLGEDMIQAYTRLYHYGICHSIEVWDIGEKGISSPSYSDRRLVGGLYGVTLGKCFFGESMFSLVSGASKLALIHLAHILQEAGGKFIDCQFETLHLRSMGGRHISYDEYIKIINSE